MFKHPTHLITPSEILSTSSEGSHSTQGMNVGGAKIHNVVVNDPKSIEVEVKVVGETRIPVISKSDELECQRESHVIVAEKKEKSFCSQASDLSIQMTRDCCVETYTIEGARQASDANVTTAIDQSPNTADEDVQDSTRDVSTKIGESAAPMIVPQSSIPSKGKKYKGKNSQVSGPSSPSPSPFNSTDSSNEPSSSSCPPSMDAAFSQLFAMPEMLDQLDNNYYRNILDNEGLLIVDHQLATDKRTKPYVKKMTKGQDHFFKEFARAITILSENNPLTGTKGEIRKQCNVVNKHH